MGAYRLFLAVLVLLSHAGITFFGINQGISAVVSFFMISGFAMTALVKKSYSDIGLLGGFYVDRILRLFPQFLFYLTTSLVFILLLRPASPFLTDLSGLKIILNYLMIPLDFYMLGLENGMIMPQGWSLGLELTFYLALPLILIYKKEKIAFYFSMLVFFLAYLGAIDTNAFAYRLLPGTLFIFLMGGFIYSRNECREKEMLFIGYAFAFALLVLYIYFQPGDKTINKSVLAGAVFGAPVVWFTSKIKKSSIDSFMGNISYGVYLNHFLLLFIAGKLGLDTQSPVVAMMIIFTSIALAIPSYLFIEKPVMDLRHRIRANNKPSMALN
ncbi:hypothetical protein C1N60_09005 [Pantoea sp. SGAir0184]